MIYHYCARVKDSVRETTIDGIAQMKQPIVNMDDYRNLKQMIVASCVKEGEVLDVNRVVILSLSVLS